MPLTRVSYSVIQVANNVTSKTVGNTTSIPSFTFDQNGVITSASNTAISGAGITANTVANSAFQTGSVENYSRAVGLLGMRNRIINGAMVIDQRNAGAVVTAGYGFSVDRWQVDTALGTSGKINQQQNAGSVTPPIGFNTYLGCTSTSAYSVLAGDGIALIQRIEGYNVADLGFGTANAKTITVSAWVYSSLTGTFGGALQNGAGNRSYAFTYSIPVANTWTQISVTIPGDTSGTWLKTNGTGMTISFGLGVGSTYSGTAGSWASAYYYSATGAVSVVGTNGATFYITGVQLEVGSSATGFEYRMYQTELNLCYRYYWKMYFTTGFAGFNDNTSNSLHVSLFPIEMRTAPTMSTTGTASNYGIRWAATSATCSAVPTFDSGTSFSGRVIGYGSLTSGASSYITTSSGGYYLAWSAEL